MLHPAKTIILNNRVRHKVQYRQTITAMSHLGFDVGRVTEAEIILATRASALLDDNTEIFEHG